MKEQDIESKAKALGLEKGYYLLLLAIMEIPEEQ